MCVAQEEVGGVHQDTAVGFRLDGESEYGRTGESFCNRPSFRGVVANGPEVRVVLKQ